MQPGAPDDMFRGMHQPWMSVVVPVYNEEQTIPAALAALRDRLETEGRPYEIVVVDNCSDDRTVDVLGPLLEPDRVRLLRNDANRGKGYSVRRGMLEASGELRLLCDADCAPSLASLTRMLAAIEQADVVAGSRSVAGADVGRTQPLRRRIVGWPFIALTRLLLREPTRDVYCGFKLWRGPAAQAVFSRQRLDGWVFDAESLAMARRLGFRVSEVGIVWINREASKLSILRTLVPAVRELLTARKNVRRQTGSGAAVPAESVVESPESTF
jgi:dolichyl-phosphate beta-glucosyltransferase